MRNILLSIFGLAFFLCGCQKDPIIEQEEPVRKINISILNTVADVSSATVSIHALGVNLDYYTRWGITYGETEEKSDGTDVKAKNTPSDGKTEVLLGGLKEETTYYIWAWAETADGERIWSFSSSSFTTRKKENFVKLSGTIIGSTYSVDYNRQNV